MKQKQHSKPAFPAGVYGITAAKFSAGRSNIEVVQQMIKGGIRLIQYREKRPHKSFAEMLDECRTIRHLTREAGVLFIINDYPAIAQLVDADGVHVGQDDFPVPAVRQLIGPAQTDRPLHPRPRAGRSSRCSRSRLHRRWPHLQHPNQRGCLCPGRARLPRPCGAHLSPALCRHRRHQGA